MFRIDNFEERAKVQSRTRRHMSTETITKKLF